jgi:hypothetical protein
MLAIILLMLADLKFTYNITQTSPNIDGGYYTDIAQHVRDGDGLKTDISLYHQGFAYFPHPTPIYPLWPWIYGMIARFSSKPILVTGINLATLFFFLSLIFGYLWANRVFPEPIFKKHLPGFTAGHVLVLMLASHKEYFIFTSQPYTEGIAYALLFAGAWRFSYLFEKGGLASGIEVGVWLGLVFLARYQLIITAIATFPALVVACFLKSSRRQTIKMLVASLLSFGTILGLHYIRLSDFIVDPHFLKFSYNRGTNLLTPFHPQVHTDMIGDFLKDRLKGFIVSFNLLGEYAFSRSFHLLHYSLLVAIPIFYIDFRRSSLKTNWTRLAEFRQNPRFPFLLFVIIFSLGGWLSIHLLHKNYYAEWNFARRQGLTCIFIFFLAILYLLRHRKFLPVLIGLLLLSTSTVIAYINYSAWVKNAEVNSGVLTQIRLLEKPSKNQEIVQYLLKERSKRDKLTIVWTAHQPQLMAPYVPGAGFHWIYDKTTLEDVKIMFDELGADYLLFYPKETHDWKFRQNSENFDKAFEAVNSLSGFRVFVRKTNKKTYEIKPNKMKIAQ